MSANLTLVLAASAMVGVGLYLMLERSLTRVLIGLVMLSNGVNLCFLVVSGPAGDPPLVNLFDPADVADPLPQAFVLTAIVITLGTTAFVLAMAYRSWQLTGADDVQDDVEDAAIRARAAADDASAGYGLSEADDPQDGDQPAEEGEDDGVDPAGQDQGVPRR